MATCVYSTVVQVLCVIWFILDLCWTVTAEEFCVRTCNCTNLQDGTAPVWPEAVAASAGAAAPVVIGGTGFLVKKLLSSSSSGSLNVSPREGLLPRKGSVPESLGGGYDHYKRRQSTLTMFDNDEDDFQSEYDYPRRSSVPSVGEEPSWSSTPRGAPMARPSFLTSAGPTASSWM